MFVCQKASMKELTENFDSWTPLIPLNPSVKTHANPMLMYD